MADSSRLANWISFNLLFSTTCCFIAGAALTSYGDSFSPLFIIIAVATCIAFLLAHYQQLDTVISSIMLLYLVLGAVHTRQALQPPQDPSHIYNLISQRSRLTLQGTITSMVSHHGDKSRFELELHAIIDRRHPGKGKAIPATGKVRLSVRGQTPPSLIPGQKILAVATVDRVNGYQTPGVFDYRLYMHSQGIYCSGWISSLHFIKTVPGGSGSRFTQVKLFPQKVRQHISQFVESRCDPITNGLYQALLIGNRSGVPTATLEQFALTGCMHLLAISGLHMGLLAFILYGLVTWILKRSQWFLIHTHVSTLAIIISFPILIAYAFIAGMNTPVLRSLIMAAVVLLAILVRRQKTILNLIAAAALMVLIFNPLALYTVSYQLSFAAILSIALIYPTILTLCFPNKTKQKQHRLLTLFRWPCTALLISVAATAGTLPFLLYHFNRFSPIGPFMNLLIEPLLCIVALPLGLIAVPLIYLVPDMAAFLFNLGGIALQAAHALTAWAGRFPFASIWTITPTTSEMITYFLLLLFSVTCSQRKLYIFTGLGFFILIMQFISGLYLPRNNESAEVSYLDVGQGTATLLELPGGKNILIDGGGSYSKRFNVGKNIIGPYLWKKRIWHIDNVIITHPDSDHYNGLDFIIQRFDPQIVYTNGQQGQSESYSDLMDLISQKDIQQREPETGAVLHSDALCRLTCLGMPGLVGSTESDNNLSLVLRLQCGENSFLFPGDIEKDAETRLLTYEMPLRADILLAAHHGSKTSNSHAFLKAVDPHLIIVSSGRTKMNIFPAPAHHVWWQQQHIKQLATGVNGTITCSSNGNRVITVYHGENGQENTYTPVHSAP